MWVALLQLCSTNVNVPDRFGQIVHVLTATPFRSELLGRPFVSDCTAVGECPGSPGRGGGPGSRGGGGPEMHYPRKYSTPLVNYNTHCH